MQPKLSIFEKRRFKVTRCIKKNLLNIVYSISIMPSLPIPLAQQAQKPMRNPIIIYTVVMEKEHKGERERERASHHLDLLRTSLQHA